MADWTDMHGVDAPVSIGRVKGDPRQGVAVARVEVEGGEPVTFIGLRHHDGTLAICMLDEEALDRFAHLLAAIVEHANTRDLAAMGIGRTMQ